MTGHFLHNLAPTITYYMDWEHVDKFLLYEDSYKEWTLFAVEEGVFYYEIEDHQGTATCGDILFCPPYTSLRRVIVEPLSFHFIRVDWYDETDTQISPDKEIMPVGKVTLQNTNRLAANYEQLKKTTPFFIDAVNNQKNHYVRDLWYMYCCEYAPQKPNPTDEASHIKDKTTQEALQLIHKRAFEVLNLKDIAAQLGISAVQLSKRFKASVGQTPVAYLTTLRLDKASQLLLETELTLDHIAQCCGYENGFYLSRIFSKHKRISPSDFRKMHRV